MKKKQYSLLVHTEVQDGLDAEVQILQHDSETAIDNVLGARDEYMEYYTHHSAGALPGPLAALNRERDEVLRRFDSDIQDIQEQFNKDRTGLTASHRLLSLKMSAAYDVCLTISFDSWLLFFLSQA